MEDGRVSTWRFIQTTEGYCSVGGNYKLLQYRDKASMEKSIKWYLSKGYTQVSPYVSWNGSQPPYSTNTAPPCRHEHRM